MSKSNLKVVDSEAVTPDRNVYVVDFGGGRRGFDMSIMEDPGNLRDQVSELLAAARHLLYFTNVDNPNSPPLGSALDGIEVLLGLAVALDSEARAGEAR
jgi:hypothetical protein